MNGPPPRTVGPVRAVLFDLDGVLINSLPVMQLAFSAALDEVYPGERIAHDALFARYRQYLGMGFSEIMARLDLSQEMRVPFRRHSLALARYVRLYDGAIELLDAVAAAGLPMGIATGKEMDRTRDLLSRLGIADRFTTVLTSDTVAAPKPAPEMVHRFAETTGVAPRDILMIGDAEADIRCGQAAGCRTAAATWGYCDHAVLAALGPDQVFASPRAAQAALETLTVQ